MVLPAHCRSGPSCTDSTVSACCCEQFFAPAIADEFVHKAYVLLDSSGLQCLKAKFCTSFLITFSFKAQQAKIVRKALFFLCLLTLYDFLPVFCIHIRIRMFLDIPDPHSEPLVRGTDLRIWIRIRIRTKMSRIPNTGVT
jgi:hypothetical protein